MLVLGAAPAAAEQIRFSFDDGRINIGQFRGEKLIDDPPGQPIGQLIGPIDLDTGEFRAPPEGLYVPPKTFEEYDFGGLNVDVVAQLTAAGPISGNFDRATGALDTRVLDVTATLTVYPAAGADLLARCVVTPIPLPIDTTGSITDESNPLAPVTYESDPFDAGGSAVGTWESLPASAPAGGPLAAAACPLVDALAAGPGGVWLAGIADLTADPPGPIDEGTDPGPRPSKKRCRKAKKRAPGKCFGGKKKRKKRS